MVVAIQEGDTRTLDPQGANELTVPIFLGLVQGRARQEKRHISMVASVTVLVTLLCFTYLGGALLDLFAITIESFRIAGGILLLLTALEMMERGNFLATGPVGSAGSKRCSSRGRSAGPRGWISSA